MYILLCGNLGLINIIHLMFRSSKQNGVSSASEKLLCNGPGICECHADMASSSHDWLNGNASWDMDDLKDEDLEPYDEDDEVDNVLKKDLSSEDISNSIKSSVVLDRYTAMFHNGTGQVATNYGDSETWPGTSEKELNSSTDKVRVDDDQDEIVSIHPSSTEFYEENDDNWCTNPNRYTKLPMHKLLL